MRLLLPILALSLLAACGSSGDEQTAAKQPQGKPAAVRASPSPSAAAAPKAMASEEANDLYEFRYAYPAAAAAIPALSTRLDRDLAEMRADLAGQAREGRTSAREGGFEFRPYSSGKDWQVVTDLPRWLSLSATVDSYTGGAHPNYWFAGLLWDKAAGQERKPEDLFISRAAMSVALRTEFCRQIDRQREEKRGSPVPQGSEDMYDACIDPADYVIIPGSSNGRAFDRIGVMVPPYEAGPYVEGAYEVTLPVTAKIMAAVKPEYRDSFAKAR